MEMFLDYRIDYIKQENGLTVKHIKAYFSDLNQAIKASKEGRRDGYKTYLLEHIADGYYNPMCELTN